MFRDKVRYIFHMRYLRLDDRLARIHVLAADIHRYILDWLSAREWMPSAAQSFAALTPGTPEWRNGVCWWAQQRAVHYERPLSTEWWRCVYLVCFNLDGVESTV